MTRSPTVIDGSQGWHRQTVDSPRAYSSSLARQPAAPLRSGGVPTAASIMEQGWCDPRGTADR
ncbi:hypothetical protein ACFYUV_10465 [Nonomuraea sp. NPDC003560]|uniref:hypothetical protein n=1 Tax=Nonomuraea sp. NPDC003560 TaxID=3364341 RepID=UPI0036CA0740